jgi:hypothetical protein
VLRCVYVDLDGALGGSLVRDADGAFTLLGARALEACDRAGTEVVIHSGESAADLALVARLLGATAFIAGDVLMLDGEGQLVDDLADAVARHLRARACAPEDAIAVGDGLGLEGVVGTLWLTGGVLEDPLVRLEAEERPHVRMAEERGPAALYEAVITTLAESRG